MNLKKRILTPGVVTFLMVATPVLALWISGMYISGNFSLTGGTVGQQTELWDVAISTTGNTSSSWTYVNDDGPGTLSYTLYENLTSQDAMCQFQTGVDVQWYLKVEDGYESEFEIFPGVPQEYDIISGDNGVELSIYAHENRCPLEGTYSITGVQV